MMVLALTMLLQQAAFKRWPSIASSSHGDIFDYFERSVGMVQDRSGKQIRRFHVEIAGDVIGDTLTLNEHFVYDDGEKQQRVWHIRRLGNDRYEGTAEDIEGVCALFL